MVRATVYVAIFLVAFNGAAGMFAVTGVGETIGIGTSIDSDGAEQIRDAAGDGADHTVGGGSGGGALEGPELFTSFAGTLADIFAVQPAMQMLASVGVPDYIIAFFNAILGIVVVIDLMYFVRGGGL